MAAIKGAEKGRVAAARKEKREKKRADAEWEKERAKERALRGRERGQTGIPQIICDATAKRWKAEGRAPRNRVVVVR